VKRRRWSEFGSRKVAGKLATFAGKFEQSFAVYLRGVVPSLSLSASIYREGVGGWCTPTEAKGRDEAAARSE
jgi:hypothetical protein